MGVTGDPETSPQSASSGWESLIWPRWLPLQARLPLIAQIAGAMALVAAVAMPRWTAAPAGSPAPSAPPAAVVPTSGSAASVAPATPTATAKPPSAPVRPAHLNLDVRHSLRSVDLSVTVDGKSVLDTKLAGSGKRFGVVGKRAERGFTRTLDVAPGVRIVRVRVRSAEDKFDQTRVERFDLDSASVAAMRISADKAGLSVVADRPAAPKAPTAPPVASLATAIPLPVPQEIPPPARAAQATTAQQTALAAQSAQEASALAELYQSLRSVLIAMAGFIASAATGFLVQEFLRTRKALIFVPDGGGSAPVRLSHAERRRRRRAGKSTDDPITSSP
jgi:hypothetical protein